nr:sulfatase [Candidatus Sigynarchaeota archaeon]
MPELKSPCNWNVLFLITHDQGIAASCLAGAGPEAHAGLPTPNFQRLADHGVVLTSHFGTAPMCSPARGSLMTGMHPHENGMVGLTHMGYGYNPGVKTVVHAFAEAGYKTMLVGLHHEKHAGKENKDRIPNLGYQENHATLVVPVCGKLVDPVNHALGELAKAGKPWWLTVGSREIHRPWTYDAEGLEPGNVSIPAYLPDTPAVRDEMAKFTRCVKAYDRFLGNVLDLLDKHGLSETTIVVMTTDHGVALPNAKGLLYEFGCHTMMIFSGPEGVIGRGSRVDGLISSIDFAPTICELCGVKPLGSFKGKSYARLLSRKNPAEPFSEYIFTENTFADIYNPIRSVRSPGFRYIRNYVDFPVADGPPNDIQRGGSYPPWREMALELYGTQRPREELYDLAKDPLQRHNIAVKDPGNPDLVKLRGVLDAWLEKSGDAIRNGPYPIPAAAVIDNADNFPHLKGHKRVLKPGMLVWVKR